MEVPTSQQASSCNPHTQASKPSWTVTHMLPAELTVEATAAWHLNYCAASDAAQAADASTADVQLLNGW